MQMTKLQKLKDDPFARERLPARQASRWRAAISRQCDPA
jgi:hypothetical protein